MEYMLAIICAIFVGPTMLILCLLIKSDKDFRILGFIFLAIDVAFICCLAYDYICKLSLL